jgi:transcriptional regulator with XRE-family HTH domain
MATLVKLRKQAGKTQTDIARVMRTDQSQVSKLERGERRLDVVDYLRICRAIGVEPGVPFRSVKAK